jgi:hypothetical protein
MKLGLKTLALALVVTLLAVPAAFAKGNGHGKSGDHGRPAWAGLGKSHEKKAKHQNKHQLAGADAATADQPQSTDLSLEDLNPAWYCKTLALLNPDTFSSLATNANGANAFGKCVSARAHGDDVAAQLGGDQPATCDQPPTDGTTTDSTGDGTTTDSTGDGTTTDSTGDGTTTDSTGDGTTTDLTGDGTSGDCQSDGSAGQDDQAGQDEQDDQGENDNAQGDEDNQGDATDPAAFAQALLSFVRL